MLQLGKSGEEDSSGPFPVENFLAGTCSSGSLQVVTKFQRWSPQDSAKVLQLAEAGHSHHECASLIGRTVKAVQAKLSWLKGGKDKRNKTKELAIAKASNAILDRIRSHGDFSGTMMELFSAITCVVLTSRDPIWKAVRIATQHQNPAAMQALGISALPEDEMTTFVKFHPALAKICVNIGFTSVPFFDFSQKVNALTKEPLRPFIDKKFVTRKSSGTHFSEAQARDELKAVGIGVAHFEDQHTGRMYENYFQQLVLGNASRLVPRAGEKSPVILTSTVGVIDLGPQGTLGPLGDVIKDGRAHSVFLCYATNIIGNKNCIPVCDTTMFGSSRPVEFVSSTREQKTASVVHIANQMTLAQSAPPN